MAGKAGRGIGRGGISFYQLNGHVLIVSDDQIVSLMVDIAQGFVDAPRIAGVLTEWAKPFPTSDDGWFDLEDDE